MTRDRAARLALVLILVTGLLVSRRLGPPRRNLTAEACRTAGASRRLLAREPSCSQNGTWTRLNQDVRLVLKFASGVGTAYEPRVSRK